MDPVAREPQALQEELQAAAARVLNGAPHRRRPWMRTWLAALWQAWERSGGRLSPTGPSGR